MTKPTITKSYHNHIFRIEDIKKHILLWDNLFLVRLNDSRIFVVAPYGFIGTVGSSTLYKGRSSNRYIELSNTQVKDIILYAKTI